MISFYEAIIDGERRGWSRHEAAERLLHGIRQPFSRGRVQGYCRVSHFHIAASEVHQKRNAALIRRGRIAYWLSEDLGLRISSKRREALHSAYHRLDWVTQEPDQWSVTRQDVRPSNIPSDAWWMFENVGPDLKSGWVDDEEDPESTAQIDWMAGTLFSSEYWEDHCAECAGCTLEVSGLSIAPNFANDLLSYSDSELSTMIAHYPGNDGDQLWKELREDPKRGGRSQESFRAMWRNERRTQGKPGRRPIPKAIP